MQQGSWQGVFLAGNRIATRTFLREKTTTKSSPTKFQKSLLTWITEKELKRQTKEANFVESKTWKLAVRRWEILGTSKVKMSGTERKKKTNRNISNKFLVSTYDISYMRCVTTKFHVVVVQNNVKEMSKKMCCKCKVSRCLRLLALHDFILI